jgi:hypothetical protein
MGTAIDSNNGSNSCNRRKDSGAFLKCAESDSGFVRERYRTITDLDEIGNGDGHLWHSKSTSS